MSTSAGTDCTCYQNQDIDGRWYCHPHKWMGKVLQSGVDVRDYIFQAKKPLVETKKMTLPTDSKERKEYPIFRGVLRYFPAALAGIAKISKSGNDKHNPGEELHHARGKSVDHGDCIIRHLLDVEDLRASLERADSTVTHQDVLNEANQLAWRALAFSQELHEKYGSPLAPGAKK